LHAPGAEVVSELNVEVDDFSVEGSAQSEMGTHVAEVIMVLNVEADDADQSGLTNHEFESVNSEPDAKCEDGGCTALASIVSAERGTSFSELVFSSNGEVLARMDMCMELARWAQLADVSRGFKVVRGVHCCKPKTTARPTRWCDPAGLSTSTALNMIGEAVTTEELVTIVEEVDQTDLTFCWTSTS
jgi:hypothetical protein